MSIKWKSTNHPLGLWCSANAAIRNEISISTIGRLYAPHRPAEDRGRGGWSVPMKAMWHGIKSTVIMSCDACVFRVGTRHDGMLKSSLGRSNRRINIIAATSRAGEGKHQDLHKQIRSRVLKSCAESVSPSARVSPGHWLDSTCYKTSSF